MGETRNVVPSLDVDGVLNVVAVHTVDETAQYPISGVPIFWKGKLLAVPVGSLLLIKREGGNGKNVWCLGYVKTDGSVALKPEGGYKEVVEQAKQAITKIDKEVIEELRNRNRRSRSAGDKDKPRKTYQPSRRSVSSPGPNSTFRSVNLLLEDAIDLLRQVRITLAEMEDSNA